MSKRTLATQECCCATCPLNPISAVPNPCCNNQRWRGPSALGKAMRRRDFIKVIAGSVAAWPLAAQAQPLDQMRRIGVLSLAAGPNPIFMDLFRGLRELGWVDGQNMAVEYRWA